MWITTKEAADPTVLGCSLVCQLIACGPSEGWKMGRDWILDKSQTWNRLKK